MDINDGSFDPELGKRSELNALALLTAAHHRSDVGTVLAAILSDATESADDSLQHLANTIEQLTNLVQGLILISHTLLVRLASEMSVGPEELLDALGRMVAERHDAAGD